MKKKGALQVGETVFMNVTKKKIQNMENGNERYEESAETVENPFRRIFKFKLGSRYFN